MGMLENRNAFEEAFIEETAKALGIDQKLLRIDQLDPGSVIVKFTVQDSSAGSKLEEMVKDPQNSGLGDTRLLSQVNPEHGLNARVKTKEEQHLEAVITDKEKEMEAIISEKADLSYLVEEQQHKIDELSRQVEELENALHE